MPIIARHSFQLSFPPGESEEVVDRLDKILRKPVPQLHREAVGEAVLNAVQILKIMDESLRNHGASDAQRRNKRQRQAAKAAAELLDKLVDPDIRAGCLEELFQTRIEELNGPSRLPPESLARQEVNAILRPMRQSMAAELDSHFAGLVDAVVELSNLLAGIPVARGARKKSSPLRHWRQDVTSKLASAYELVYGRSPDQGRDWVSLAKFVHERAGLACEDELARTFSPAWQAVHRPPE